MESVLFLIFVLIVIVCIVIVMNNKTIQKFYTQTPCPSPSCVIGSGFHSPAPCPGPSCIRGGGYANSPAPCPGPSCIRGGGYANSPAPCSGSSCIIGSGSAHSPAPCPGPSCINSLDSRNKITVKFNKSCVITDSDIEKIKSVISDTVNISTDKINISCGSIKIDIILPDGITKNKLETILDKLYNKRFNVILASGVILERLSTFTHNVKTFKEPVRYMGPIESESDHKKNSDLQEFTEFMSMFGGTTTGNNKNRKGNIIQYEPNGPANIFSPFLKIS